MYFIIVTCIVLLISVLATYKLAKYWDLKVKLKPLFLCGGCALFINFVLPIIPSKFSQYHLLIFLFTATIFAVFIARYNETLCLAAGTPPAHCSADLAAPKKFLPQKSLLPPAVEPTAIAVKIPEIPSPAPISPVLQPPDPLFSPASFFKKKNKPCLKKLHKTLWRKPAAVQQDALLQSSAVPATVSKAIPSRRSFKKIGHLLQIKKVAMNSSAPKEPASTSIPADDLLLHIKTLRTLDDLLDYAENQKTLKNYTNAACAFKHALHVYENDDYAPFIAIELGNIYKNTGLYEEAIVIYNKAYSLPSVTSSKELQKEFQNNINYLHIVKTVLSLHNCPKMAFIDIPVAIMQEIENTFTVWLSQKYAS